MGKETVSQTNDYKQNPEVFVYLKADKNIQNIFIDNILYIESWKDYIKLFPTTGKNLLLKQSISSMENLLSDHRFLRGYRSYIVSVNKISIYNGLSMQMNVAEIPIGRLYKQTVMETLQAHS